MIVPTYVLVCTQHVLLLIIEFSGALFPYLLDTIISNDKWLCYHVFLIQLSQGQMVALSCLIIDLQIYSIF